MWIILTLLAVFFQIFRNLEQKNLSKKVDAITSSWARFIMPFPIAIILVLLTFQNYNFVFFKYILTNAFFQMLGSIFLIKAMQSKNFSIAVALGKTETIQALIIGYFFYNLKILPFKILLLILSFIGIILMSDFKFKNRQEFIDSIKNPKNFYGILCGSCFAITAFNLKDATQILINENYHIFLASTIVLLWTIFFQNIFFILIKIKEKSLISSIKSLWHAQNRKSFFIASIFSFIGSFFWYSAYSFGEVLGVKILAQIEIIIAILISIYYFNEKHNLKNLIGIFITLFSIITILSL